MALGSRRMRRVVRGVAFPPGGYLSGEPSAEQVFRQTKGFRESPSQEVGCDYVTCLWIDGVKGLWDGPRIAGKLPGTTARAGNPTRSPDPDDLPHSGASATTVMRQLVGLT